jgi:prophage antirepressor-like protein
MKDITFHLACINAELPAILLDNKSWLFHCQRICVLSEIASESNTARWVKDNIPKKWTQVFAREDQIGRPALYLLLPGFLYALSQSKSEIGLAFRDEVYENILPAIIEKGGYIAPEATTEQLEALQSQIDIQQNMILQMGRDLTDLNSKKKEYETRVNDWETDIKNDIDGNPMTYYKFLKEERKGILELEAKAKQLEAVKEALKLKPTKAKIIELILAGSDTE